MISGEGDLESWSIELASLSQHDTGEYASLFIVYVIGVNIEPIPCS